jgi:vitamin B12/bleomycin/antimicrobial peptide transport system ATP-binding/permease protein
MLNPTYLAPDERQLLARFWQSASGYWRGRSAWRTWLLVAVLIATVLLQLLTQYGLNYWNRDFFNAIGRKDAAELWTQALWFVPLATASLALTVFSVWARMTMQRRWREWLSNHLYDYWLKDDRYVRLGSAAADHQAPEYRIAEDARVATDLPVDLVLGLFQSMLNAVTFIGILWSVGDGLSIELGGFAVSIPGYLVIAVIAYSALLTASIFLIASHLTRVMEENKRSEAELRSVGTHLRESGEGKAVPDSRKDARQSSARH